MTWEDVNTISKVFLQGYIIRISQVTLKWLSNLAVINNFNFLYMSWAFPRFLSTNFIENSKSCQPGTPNSTSHSQKLRGVLSATPALESCLFNKVASFQHCNFIKRESNTATQVFSGEYCKIFNNRFFHKTPLMALSELFYWIPKRNNLFNKSLRYQDV